MILHLFHASPSEPQTAQLDVAPLRTSQSSNCVSLLPRHCWAPSFASVLALVNTFQGTKVMMVMQGSPASFPVPLLPKQGNKERAEKGGVHREGTEMALSDACIRSCEGNDYINHHPVLLLNQIL